MPHQTLKPDRRRRDYKAALGWARISVGCLCGALQGVHQGSWAVALIGQQMADKYGDLAYERLLRSCERHLTVHGGQQ